MSSQREQHHRGGGDASPTPAGRTRARAGPAGEQQRGGGIERGDHRDDREVALAHGEQEGEVGERVEPPARLHRRRSAAAAPSEPRSASTRQDQRRGDGAADDERATPLSRAPGRATSWRRSPRPRRRRAAAAQRRRPLGVRRRADQHDRHRGHRDPQRPRRPQLLAGREPDGHRQRTRDQRGQRRQDAHRPERERQVQQRERGRRGHAGRRAPDERRATSRPRRPAAAPTSTSRLAGAVIATTRSTCAPRAASPPAKSAHP